MRHSLSPTPLCISPCTYCYSIQYELSNQNCSPALCCHLVQVFHHALGTSPDYRGMLCILLYGYYDKNDGWERRGVPRSEEVLAYVGDYPYFYLTYSVNKCNYVSCICLCF